MINLGQWNFVKELTFTKPKTPNRHIILNIRLELCCVCRVVLIVCCLFLEILQVSLSW